MSNEINLSMLIKHLANGTISEKMCRICLFPLSDLYEDVFTKICKANAEYCVSDVLEEVCNIKCSKPNFTPVGCVQICTDDDERKKLEAFIVHLTMLNQLLCLLKNFQVDKSEVFRVCPKCFLAAGEAYRFYLQSLHSQELLNFYIDKLNVQLSIDIPEHLNAENVCLSLPVLSPQTKVFDYDISNHPYKSISDSCVETKFKRGICRDIIDNDEIILCKDRNEKEKKTLINKEKKFSRKRHPMPYKMCSRCPVQYRFVGKLKEHMKAEHGVDLFECQVCKVLLEDENEFNTHLQTHTGIHTCEKCNMVFKKRKTIIEHLKWHEAMKITSQEGTYVCEICGVMLANEADLNDHTDKKHVNKYNCYYCGRMYKMKQSFDLHIKKHEMHMNSEVTDPPQSKTRAKRHTCSHCGRDFVDGRALLWHERLHAGERPYGCGACGRRFVSQARRDQHRLCAHTAPTRRCPLCPALFHLRSMVNTHIKKVHLRTNKRRNRHCKTREVFWRTETVPIQELSIAVQNKILEMQTARESQL